MTPPGKWQIAFLVTLVVIIALSLLGIYFFSAG